MKENDERPDASWFLLKEAAPADGLAPFSFFPGPLSSSATAAPDLSHPDELHRPDQC
jgi:hypothetical protein